ncbi:hypothetical protein [Streptosporangium sp. NPDC020145]|uniref:hypothetical protein n=1 Tax=Streptosporangium sp. NPDC020145 TaxID=3154694 RepID=UPI003433D44D
MSPAAISEATASITRVVQNSPIIGPSKLAAVIVGELLDIGWVLPDLSFGVDRDLDPLAVFAYETGCTPREWAVRALSVHIDAWATVSAARQKNPDSFPIWRFDLSVEALATRLVGHLLDDGWSPPGGLVGVEVPT